MRELVLVTSLLAIAARNPIAIPLFSDQVMSAVDCCARHCSHSGPTGSCDCCHVRPDLVEHAATAPYQAPASFAALPAPLETVPRAVAVTVCTSRAAHGRAVPVFLELQSLRL